MVGVTPQSVQSALAWALMRSHVVLRDPIDLKGLGGSLLPLRQACVLCAPQTKPRQRRDCNTDMYPASTFLSLKSAEVCMGRARVRNNSSLLHSWNMGDVALTHGQRHRDGLPKTDWYGPPCLAADRTRPWDRSWRRRKAALKTAQGRVRAISYIVSFSLV